METVLSGTRPTGKLHLGNYFGAVKNYVQSLDQYNSYFFIADYHSLTTHASAEFLKENVRAILVNYLACGLDPDKCSLYIQSDLPETAELYLLLNMFAYKGELEKVPTFKEKIRSKSESINVGLLTYPTLMAADILIHRAHKVPVGKDQAPHLEMTRNFASRFNQFYGVDFFPEPEGLNFEGELIKVPGLDGSTKMSKSEGEKNCIYLSDEPEVVLKKVKKAKTDAGPTVPNAVRPQEVINLFDIMKLVSPTETYQFFDDGYNDCSIRYGDFKVQIAKDINTFLVPFRERINDLQGQEAYLKRVTKEGAEKAKESAAKTLKGAREIIGLTYY